MTSIGNKAVLAKNLTYYVEKSGKTQKELAEIVGVATSTFNDWMKGKKYPRIDRIEILANYFGILKSDLIEDRRAKPAKDDGLSESQVALIRFAETVSAENAPLALRVLQSLLGDSE